MGEQKKPLVTTVELTTVSILGAVASMLFFWSFSVVPGVPFYKMDFSNIPVLLGTFAMGPLAGVLILAVKSLSGLLHSTSMYVGELADFLIGLGMVIPAGLMYRRQKTRKGAIAGMVIGTVLATLVAAATNIYIMIPFFSAAYGMPIQQIVNMGKGFIPSISSLAEFVLYITTPFNLLKWSVLSVIGALLYKPLSPVLHGRVRGMRRSGATLEDQRK